eukprot:TRINITY_DN3948_c0_g2_i1.p1 TRINITY_DN3948_c0_g2~~TRINITY_DN3948_c0_g2_i1.p1  ORF type:complete len:554 (+),score=189.40 TRINITY_DN3948_c0_g2_i1:67-1728(+)
MMNESNDTLRIKRRLKENWKQSWNRLPLSELCDNNEVNNLMGLSENDQKKKILNDFLLQQKDNTIDELNLFIEEREKDIKQAVKLGQELLQKNKKLQLKIEERDSKLDELSQLSNRYNELNDKLHLKNQENELLIERVEKAKVTLKDYEIKMYQLDENAIKLEEKIESQKKEINNLIKEKSKHIQMLQDFEQVKQKVLILEKENNILNEKLKKEIRSKEDKKDTTNYFEEMYQLKSDLEEKNHEIKRLNTQMIERSHESSVQLEEMNDKMKVIQNEFEKMKESYENVRSDNKNLKMMNNELNELRVELRDEVDSLKEKVEMLQNRPMEIINHNMYVKGDGGSEPTTPIKSHHFSDSISSPFTPTSLLSQLEEQVNTKNLDFVDIVNLAKQERVNNETLSPRQSLQDELQIDSTIVNTDDLEYLLTQLIKCKSHIAITENAENELLHEYYSVEKVVNDCRAENIEKKYLEKHKKTLTPEQISSLQKKRLEHADSALQLFKLFQTEPPIKFKPILFKHLQIILDLIRSQYQKGVHNVPPPSPVKIPPKKKKYLFF